MDNKDYSELALLLKGAETALFSGELNDWQHATTSTFHMMAQFILDLNTKYLALAQLYDANILGSAYPSTDQSILTTTDLENDRDL